MRVAAAVAAPAPAATAAAIRETTIELLFEQSASFAIFLHLIFHLLGGIHDISILLQGCLLQ
jgi:hypothetical protein